MIRKNKDTKNTNGLYKENSTEYIKNENNTKSSNREKKNINRLDNNVEIFKEKSAEYTTFEDTDKENIFTKDAKINLDTNSNKENTTDFNKIDDFNTINIDSTPNTLNINEKNHTKQKQNKKGKFIIIYIIIVIGMAISFFNVKNKISNNTNINNSDNTSNLDNSTVDNKPIVQKIPISIFNASNINLETLADVQNAQASQLATFTDKLHNPFVPSDYELDSMSLNLLNGLYIRCGSNSANDPLTKEFAQKILNNTTIPFTIVNSTHSDTMQNQNIGVMLTLDNNLHVTDVINDPSKGVALVSFNFATKFENEGGLITVKGIALLNYMNGTWNYSRMIEQKSVRTYPYITTSDLKNIFNTAMINRNYNLIPSSINISNIKVIDPYIITADISGKGVNTFANGQINKSNINETWQVTFIKDRTSMVSTTFKKLIVAQWNVYKAQTINRQN